jgi:hypothetical protein
MELPGYVILLVQTIDDEMKLYGEFIKLVAKVQYWLDSNVSIFFRDLTFCIGFFMFIFLCEIDHKQYEFFQIICYVEWCICFAKYFFIFVLFGWGRDKLKQNLWIFIFVWNLSHTLWIFPNIICTTKKWIFFCIVF